MQFITAMEEYSGKSLEQLRYEDLLLKKHGVFVVRGADTNTNPAHTDPVAAPASVESSSNNSSFPPSVFVGTQGLPFTVVKVSSF